MRLLVRVASVCVTAAAALLAGCAGDSTERAGTSDLAAAGGPTWEDAAPVKGDFTVLWQDLNPKNQQTRFGLVNESSEIGQKLKSGKASSSEIRVLTDVEMGGLISKLTELGFFKYASDGVDIDNAPDVPGRRGIVVVRQDGHSKGLLFRTNLGAGPLTNAYLDSKKIILYVHGQVPGWDMKAQIGAPDERVFDAPKIQMKRP